MIYKDAMGNPKSEATITVVGAMYGAPGQGHHSLQAASNAPEKKWPYESKDVSAIIEEMDAAGWDCSVRKDGYGAPVIDCIHRETQMEINKIKIKSESDFANAEKGFIRFGNIPATGKSINYRDKTPEKGVSVFNAEFSNGKYRVILDSIQEATYNMVSDRPAYRIFGEIVGTGADGEPVVKIIKFQQLKK